MNIGLVIAGTLGRYFALRFFLTFLAVFAGVFVLVALIDYIELMRHRGQHGASAWLFAQTSIFRVPQLSERILPFAVLIAAMASFLNLSRRLELVVTRSAGMSAWQFIAPALVAAAVVGVLATTAYNPVAAVLHEKSKRLELQIFGGPQTGLQSTGAGFSLRQRSSDGQSILNAITTSEQGLRLGGITAFTFDEAGKFLHRIEAKTAVLQTGFWELHEARIYASDVPPAFHEVYALKTNLTATQVRESFATPESVPFWELPSYIEAAERAGVGAARYRLQYQKLLARPFLLIAMVLVAAAVSLRFFRFGGVQKMILGGIAAGFLLYVLSKIADDLSKAQLMPAIAAAWTPVLVGGLAGLVALLYQEDG